MKVNVPFRNMKMAKQPLNIIDLFAGPGGLGEGFSSLDDGESFKIVVSAEMEASAHQTLRLRAYFRLLKKSDKDALKDYYDFCNGLRSEPFTERTRELWDESGREAQQLTLGNDGDNSVLHKIISNNNISESLPWVLIGGPPCQAYSLVGRSRNLGKLEYKPEEDPRHYLYKEYLSIIQKYKPAVFVMENVKGILSSKINGEKIFHNILNDLCNPDKSLGQPDSGYKYRIHSLVTPAYFEAGMDAKSFNAKDFVIRAEDYGIPQARHRVILLGIRSDHLVTPQQLKRQTNKVNVEDVIGALPKLRSKLSKEEDGLDSWNKLISSHLNELYEEASKISDLVELTQIISDCKKSLISNLGVGSYRLQMDKSNYYQNKSKNTELNSWLEDHNLRVWLNSETRGHMSSDLKRYAYATLFSKAYDKSPKGHEEFSLPGLAPNHLNWESGKFSDRFRVQLANRPATTVTSHISKDGHYFIHPDATQCRSLTVREAARIQTFPDNYFFQGNRTQQYHQVGNAVPPLLAYKISKIVKNVLDSI